VLTEYVSPQPIFAGAVAWPDGRTTIVVKLTLAVGATGKLEPASTQDPLTLDVTDGRGEIVYPSDFAPYKPSCDVSIVGEAVADRGGPGRVYLDALVKAVEPRETLGPRQTFCPSGDPTDAAAFALWTTGGIDFARFQIAPPDRRLPWPTHGFNLGYARGALTLSTRFDGPTVRGYVLSQDATRILARVPLPLDTVLFDPVQRRAWLLFRGVYAPSAGALVSRCAIEPSTMPMHDAHAMASWRASPLATPSASRSASRARPADRGAPVAPDETRVLSGPIASASLPFASQRAPQVPQPREPSALHDLADAPTVLGPHHADVTSPAIRAPAKTLPFQRPTAPTEQATTPLSPQDLGELRARGAQHVPNAWEAGSETRVARPTAPAPAAPARNEPVAVAPPARAMFQLQAAPPPPVTFSEARPAARSEELPPAPSVGHAPLTEARFQEIVQEVWKGERPLAETLARHGLTEEEWRELKRARAKR
jgi:hypothetical protein